MKRAGILALMIVLAVSCGDDDDAATNASQSVQPTTTPTSTVAAPTTSATTVPPTSSQAEPSIESSPEVVDFSDSSQRLTPRPAGTTASPLGYDEYLPPDYADDGASPLLVFLHGSGESGDGTESQLRNLTGTGIPADIASDSWPNDRPFVVLAPQHEMARDQSAYADCDSVVEFFGSCYLTRQHDLGHPTPGSVCFTPAEIDTFLAYAVSAYDVDPQRVYLTGLSCGAFGGFEYLAEHGNAVVAAAVLIAGEARPAWGSAGCALGAVPIWAFHGMADDTVDPAGSIEPLTQLQHCTTPPPVEALLTTYEDADHDSWTRTYAVGAEHDIYTWMRGFSNPVTDG